MATIDYAVAFNDTAAPGTTVNGTFSVDYTNLTVTNLNIISTNGTVSTNFTMADNPGLSDAAGFYQLQVQTPFGLPIFANTYIAYNDPSQDGNATFLTSGSQYYSYVFSDGSTFGMIPNEGNIVQGSTIPAFCFTRDTLISTPTGSTPVQDLQIGDLILNHVGQSVPVKWIGTQRFHPAFAGDGLPICIRQGALGHGLPLRDLYVSPGHAMYIDNCLLIDAKAMINGTTITQVTQWEGDIEYFHIETENHEIILAEGSLAETFIDNVSRTSFNNYSQYQTLYPDAKEMIELDIPRVSHQRQLPNAVKRQLEQIAQELVGVEKMINAA